MQISTYRPNHALLVRRIHVHLFWPCGLVSPSTCKIVLFAALSDCMQAGVPCGPQCKCCDCLNCIPGQKGLPHKPAPAHPTGPPTAAQQAAHGQGPTKVSPGTPAVRYPPLAVLNTAKRASHAIMLELADHISLNGKQERLPTACLPSVHDLHQ